MKAAGIPLRLAVSMCFLWRCMSVLRVGMHFGLECVCLSVSAYEQATRAYLHKEEDVEAALNKAGFKVTNREMTASKFYFSRLFEAVPAS